MEFCHFVSKGLFDFRKRGRLCSAQYVLLEKQRVGEISRVARPARFAVFFNVFDREEAEV